MTAFPANAFVVATASSSGINAKVSILGFRAVVCYSKISNNPFLEVRGHIPNTVMQQLQLEITTPGLGNVW
jgi:hypothetical protein